MMNMLVIVYDDKELYLFAGTIKGVFREDFNKYYETGVWEVCKLLENLRKWGLKLIESQLFELETGATVVRFRKRSYEKPHDLDLANGRVSSISGRAF